MGLWSEKGGDLPRRSPKFLITTSTAFFKFPIPPPSPVATEFAYSELFNYSETSFPLIGFPFVAVFNSSLPFPLPYPTVGSVYWSLSIFFRFEVGSLHPLHVMHTLRDRKSYTDCPQTQGMQQMFPFQLSLEIWNACLFALGSLSLLHSPFKAVWTVVSLCPQHLHLQSLPNGKQRGNHAVDWYTDCIRNQNPQFQDSSFNSGYHLHSIIPSRRPSGACIMEHQVKPQ